MNTQKPQLYFLLTILGGTFVLTFFIFRPFIYSILLAVVFTVLLQPIYQRIVNFTSGHKGFAAFATVLIVVVFIFGPLIFLGAQIFKEAQQLYFSIANSGGKDVIRNILNNLLSDLKSTGWQIPAIQEFSINLDEYLKQGLSWLIQHLGSIFASFTKIVISFLIFLITLYCLLKDGQKLKAAIINLSPLSDTDDRTILKKLEVAINSVIKGSLFVALIQGVLTMIGFAIFGVPNAVLWGSVAVIAALIPSIGTALVFVPGILFLFLAGKLLASFGLLAWGVGAVGLIDNFLGPKLIGRGAQVHPLIILLSVLGGIGFFGPIGFLLGPLTITLFFALLEIYSSLIRS